MFVDVASGQCNSYEITGRNFIDSAGVVNFGWRLFIFVQAKKFSLNIHISERAQSVNVLRSSTRSTLTRSITKIKKKDGRRVYACLEFGSNISNNFSRWINNSKYLQWRWQVYSNLSRIVSNVSRLLPEMNTIFQGKLECWRVEMGSSISQVDLNLNLIRYTHGFFKPVGFWMYLCMALINIQYKILIVYLLTTMYEYLCVLCFFIKIILNTLILILTFIYI